MIAEWTAVRAEGIVQAIRFEGASGPEWIGRGIRIVRIGTQFAEVFRVDGEQQREQPEKKEEDNPHGDPRIEHVASEFSLAPSLEMSASGATAAKKGRMSPFISLVKFRAHSGSLTRAAFLSARNDALANIAIIAAGFVTAYTLSGWPDLIVGLGIATMNADAAWEVWNAAREEHRTANSWVEFKLTTNACCHHPPQL